MSCSTRTYSSKSNTAPWLPYTALTAGLCADPALLLLLSQRLIRSDIPDVKPLISWNQQKLQNHLLINATHTSNTEQSLSANDDCTCLETPGLVGLCTCCSFSKSSLFLDTSSSRTRVLWVTSGNRVSSDFCGWRAKRRPLATDSWYLLQNTGT